ILQFIFSPNNGMFLYIPAMFVCFVCGLFFYRNNKALIGSAVFIIAVSLYIHSSWWIWYYGDSFGSRTMTDLLCLYGILIAYSLSAQKTGIKKIFIMIYSLCVLLTLILYHQRHHGYLSDYPIHDYGDAILGIFK